jgi:CRP-like cAMP-binding protein
LTAVHDRQMRTDETGNPVQNQILNSIPEPEYKQLRSLLEFVPLPAYYVLHEAGEEIEFVHFLNDGLVSLVVQTSDGRSVEIAVIGREGVVGAPLALDLPRRRPYQAMLQIPGSCVRIEFDILEDALKTMPALRRELNRHLLVRGLQIAQIAACNRLHEIDQRLARWLLMCRDRVDSDLLPVTHELLAQMLGTGRPSVSLAAGILQKTGIIETSRGAVRILDRTGLESAACECYRVIEQFSRPAEASADA